MLSYRRAVAAGIAAVLVLAAHPVAFSAGTRAAAATCALGDDDDDDDDPLPSWKRFSVDGICVGLSGYLSAIFQGQKGNLSLLTRRGGGTVAGGSRLRTYDADFRIDTFRSTEWGDLKTGFEVLFERTSADTGAGSFTLEEGILTWGGLKVGYTDSQIDFWSGDFQFTASAPQRTVGLAGWEFGPGSDWTLTFAYETGLPTSPSSANAFVSAYPSNPAASARLYYDADDVEIQLSGLVHEMHVETSHPIFQTIGLTPKDRMHGWAATVGLTLPVKPAGEDCEFSMQATYAVNGAPYLGTAADFSALARTIPVPVSTRGWSIVGSYQQNWSKQWATNVMASYLALDVSLPHRVLDVRTSRFAANLIWQPVDSFNIGVEIGLVESTLDTGGFLRGVSGKGAVGYLFAQWNF